MAGGKEFLVDLSTIDFDNVIADVDDIRALNPQRHEMEQITAIVHEDMDRLICVGYKDITRDEFWVRGHMPGMPLMPGVVMLESIAQTCSYFAQRHDLLGVDMVGFGGLEKVRFRDPVLPGDRFITICQQVRVRRGQMIVCRFQGIVGGKLAVDGTLKGIPIPVDALRALKSND